MHGQRPESENLIKRRRATKFCGLRRALFAVVLTGSHCYEQKSVQRSCWRALLPQGHGAAAHLPALPAAPSRGGSNLWLCWDGHCCSWGRGGAQAVFSTNCWALQHFDLDHRSRLN